MGFWDWATTAREGVQGAVGTAWNNPVSGAAIGNPKYAPELIPGRMVLSGINALRGGGGGGSTPATPTTSTTTPGPTAPTTGGTVYYNPLASSMYASQLLQPLFTNLANQFHSWNQQAANTPNPMGQYLSPDQKAAFGQQMAQIGAGNDQVTASLMGAALASPAIDSLQQSMNTLSQRALNSYVEALKTGATQQTALTNIFATNPNLAASSLGNVGVGGAGTIKGNVQSQSNLPNTGNTVGDMYTVADQQGATYEWDGQQWTKTG